MLHEKNVIPLKPRSHLNCEQVRSAVIMTFHECGNCSKFVCCLDIASAVVTFESGDALIFVSMVYVLVLAHLLLLYDSQEPLYDFLRLSYNELGLLYNDMQQLYY